MVLSTAGADEFIFWDEVFPFCVMIALFAFPAAVCVRLYPTAKLRSVYRAWLLWGAATWVAASLFWVVGQFELSFPPLSEMLYV